MNKVIYFESLGGRKVGIIDVANWFIKRSQSEEEASMTPLKLQKLCYYAKAWSMVWDDNELFKEKFEAWVHGPANYILYKKYSNYSRNAIIEVDGEFDEQIFTDDELETLEVVWESYGKYTGKYLEELTHMERPWKETRKGLAPGVGSDREIPNKLIKEFYSEVYDE